VSIRKSPFPDAEDKDNFMDKTIQERIIDYLKPVSENLSVADVRIGLAYTSVRLENGNLGLAWTARKRSEGCTHEPKAGTLAGRPAGEMLELLVSANNPLSRSIGLATANALAAGMPRPETTSVDVLDLVDIQASEHVVMVGFFGPLIPRLRRIGCRLDILELKRDRPGTMSPEEGRASLAACNVAILTATSVVTGTTDDLLSGLEQPRAAIILGPSSFMRPEVFSGTPVTHIAGVRVRNAPAVEKIVSEGGGTRILKPHMDFVTLCLEP
jgi:uncharacterized protein (DUF4213/DUF364 family)